MSRSPHKSSGRSLTIAQSMDSTSNILSILPREIRDEIWDLCIKEDIEELKGRKRRMSFCLDDCKEPRSCFPYDFFGPVCSACIPPPARTQALRRMHLAFTCKQILDEVGSLYCRTTTFFFRSAQCLQMFSLVLGRERLQACISQLEVREELRPCLGRNEAQLSLWRASVEKNVKTLTNGLQADWLKDTSWTVNTGQTEEDAFTHLYWINIRLTRTKRV